MTFNKLAIKILLALLLLNIGVAAQTEDSELQSAVNALKQLEANNKKVSNSTAEPMKDNYIRIGKTTGSENRKSFIMNGNRITAAVYNYGGIGPGYGLVRHNANGVWNNLGYLFQFCPFIAASVVDTSGEVKHIVSDALNDYGGLFEVNPNDATDLWQWQPLEGYADPDQIRMASNPAVDSDGDGKPDSWPRSWYDERKGEYVWPGFLSRGATNADLEVYWAMDDRDNAEFDYFPFPDDSTRRGLGVQIDGRAFQWSNPLAENTIFFVYTVTNTSPKDLDTVVFGIYGDADVGGGSPENTDDSGFFVPPSSTPDVNVDNIPVYARSMVYFYDEDREGDRGLRVGYIACKFLESPGAVDGKDNDGDGYIDETQYDGIDNDNDWDINKHDVGIDGVADTGDEGEGDGYPTAGLTLPDGAPDPLYPGEPNFEFTDKDESDQIGLTSFNSWKWKTGGAINDDENMWSRLTPGDFSDIQNRQDLVFIFGSGYISLDAEESKRISMALLYGNSYSDLLLSAETIQTIYNENYQFFKPPLTPTVTAVPGDKKVTLYWDSAAETSVDPITGKDFEGYVIYRSTEPDFSDIQTITDGRNSPFLNQPLLALDGTEAKFDVDFVDEPFTDLDQNGYWNNDEPYEDINKNGLYDTGIEDEWVGYHPVEYQGRGVHYYLGDNTGIVHSYVDSNKVVNGQTYYYAVVAYDHGDKTAIPPTETTKKIFEDPITAELVYDKNTVGVVPGPRASGYVEPPVSSDILVHENGRATAKIEVNVMDDLQIVDNGKYQISFHDSISYMDTKLGNLNYDVLDMLPKTETVVFYDTNFTQLAYGNISEDSYVELKDAGGNTFTEGADYVVNYLTGSIRRTGTSSVPVEANCTFTYRNYVMVASTAFEGEDTNPIFDGVQLKLYDEPIVDVDIENSGWVEGNTNANVDLRFATAGANKFRYPADYEITFSSEHIDSAFDGRKMIPVNYSVREITPGYEPQKVLTVLRESRTSQDSMISKGEIMLLYVPNAQATTKDTVAWQFIWADPADSLATLIPPTDGDVFVLRTKRPFRYDDVFTFETESGKVDNAKAENSMDDIYVVPNPYVGYNEIEPVNALPNQSRGERRIYFENLPSKCTIRIYTLSGELVTTLEHDAGTTHAREYWNLLNKDGFGVAYGVYIAHIDAPGVGEKIVKFALIK